jgi:hypothetical protein
MTVAGSFGTPEYRPGKNGSFKPLGKQRGDTPRVGKILGIEPQVLMDALAVACAAGCAVMFSPTSDGGALGVIVYAGEQRHRGWASDAEEFGALLSDVRDVSEAHMVGGPARKENGALKAR